MFTFSEYIPMEGLEQSSSQSRCTRKRSSLKSKCLCWKLSVKVGQTLIRIVSIYLRSAQNTATCMTS